MDSLDGCVTKNVSTECGKNDRVTTFFLLVDVHSNKQTNAAKEWPLGFFCISSLNLLSAEKIFFTIVHFILF